MSDAFDTAEEELNFILGNDNNNDGSDVNDLFEDTAAVEDTMLFIDSPSRGQIKSKSSLNFTTSGEGGLVHDGTSSYNPAAAAATEDDEQKHTISRMVSLSPPPSLPPSLTHHPSHQAAAASTTDFASLYALNSLKDQNDIFDLLNNDPPVMSSLVPGSSNGGGVGGDLSYSHSENDPYKELLPVMNNNNSLLQQQLHNMLPRSLPSNTNIDKMLDTFKIEEGEYDSLNLLDTMLNVEQMTTAAATFQDLQDRLGQFHPVNNGVGGGLGGLFGGVSGGLPPLSPQYDDLLHSSSSTTKASSSSSITPDRLQGQVYVPIVHSVAHLPLPTPSRGGGGETNTKKVGHNKRRPLRKRKVSMSDIAPEDVSELNLLQVEEPILDFFSNYTTDISGLVPSVSVVGGGSRSSSRKKVFGYRAPTIFHSLSRLKGLKPILPTGAEAIAARRARKVRRLARAKAQVVNLVGAEDVDDIVEDTISIITNVNVMSTIEKCQEELVMDFTENLNVKVFVDSVWENTDIKNKITEEVDVAAAAPVPKDSLEIKLPQDCPSSPHPKGSTTTTCVTPNEKKTTVPSKAEKSGPSSADHLKLLPEGKDPESRRLRRLMRNRLSAQASRDRRKKVVDDLMKEKETKRNEIELLKQQVLEEQKRMILLEKAVSFALGNEKYSSVASIANSSNIIQSV